MSAPHDPKVENAPAYGVTDEQTEAAPQEPARMGPLARLTGVLFSPGETFQDINRKPTWIAPVIIGILAAVAITLVFNWRVNPNWDQVIRNSIRRQVESRGGQMPPPEQIDQQVAFGKFMAKISPALVVVFTPVYYLLLSGIFALGLMLMAAQATFKKILSVVAWSAAGTGVVGALVTIASLMIRDQESLRDIDPTQSSGLVPTNLGALLSSETAATIRTLASSLDIFTIWFLILLTIGFAAISGSRRITTAKTATVVFGLWAVWVLVKVGWAAAFGG